MCPFFVKTVLNTFAVCSLVPRINLSHTQQSYLCPRNQNYLLGKADLKFFLRHGLRTTIKITTLLKLTLLHGCFSHFLNCTNGTKSRNAPQMNRLLALTHFKSMFHFYTPREHKKHLRFLDVFWR